MSSATTVTTFEADGGARRPPVVGLADATVRVHGRTVLRGVDLTVAAGEVLALTGANGSGKSTLLRVLAGLVPVSGGRLLRAAVPARDDASAQIALVAHENSLGAVLTLRENLDLVASLLDREPDAVTRSLERVGLAAAADRPVSACSQGMARRAELARVLLTAPQLMLLDEAHAALDVSARSLVAEIARDVAQRGGATVVVTHDVEDARVWSDRVLEVRDGRVADAPW